MTCADWSDILSIVDTTGLRKPVMAVKPIRTIAAARRDAVPPKSVFSDPEARVRICFPAQRQLGPGKIALLEAIGRTGSISAAGREMGMSYRRAWLLIDAANKLFTRPLVLVSIGGQAGGGTQLTDFGRALIAAYHRVQERTRDAIREEMAPFEADLPDTED